MAAVTVAAPVKLSPDDLKREKLMQDEDFSKSVRAYKVKVPLLQIRNSMRAQGKYDPDDILLFASKSDIAALKKLGDYKGNKY